MKNETCWHDKGKMTVINGEIGPIRGLEESILGCQFSPPWSTPSKQSQSQYSSVLFGRNWQADSKIHAEMLKILIYKTILKKTAGGFILLGIRK